VAYILIAVFLQGLASVLVTRALSRGRPSWSKRRLISISAAPIPLIVGAFSAYLFIKVSLTTKEQCGVDACGYAMIGVFLGATAAVLLYLFGMGLSALVMGRAPRREPKDFSDIFS
jgi:hypothetical protein